MDPGKYQLAADFGRKEWKILGVGARSKKEPIRFTVDLDGPDPFTLTYSSPCQLEITRVLTADSYVPDPFIDMLPDVGANAFRNDPDYVDNGIVAGLFDLIGKSFTLTYEDGQTFELTNHISWAGLVDQNKAFEGATIYTYYRLMPPAANRILPRRFDKNSAPNIAFMVKDIQETIPGAQIQFQLGRILLDFVQIGPRPLGRGVKGPSTTPRPMRLRGMPKDRINPVNGTVNVGGGLEKGSGAVTNLNPIVPGTGGPTRGIPNHVPASFEDMDQIFLFGSVQKVMSNRLPFSTVNWPASAQAAFNVMGRGGN